MAQRAIHQFDSKQALEYYSKAIELDPTNAKYYFARAELKNLKREKASALKDYNKAIELDPNNAEYYYYRGKSKIGYDNLGALKDYNKAIELAPNNAEYYYDRALFKVLTIKDYQGALADCTEAIKLDPTNSQYYFQRGNIKRILNDLDGAIEDLKMATRYNLDFGLYEEFLAEYTKELKIEKAKAAKARQAKAAEEAKIKAEQEARKAKAAEEARQAKAAEEARQAEFTRKEMDKDATQRAAEKRSREKRATQKAYDDFEETISKESRQEVKAQYLIEQARLLRYANGTGRESIIIEGSEVSYKKAAMLSYDRAIEYAPTPEVKAKYLSERATFKYMNGDLEGAMMDLQTAGELTPNIKNN